MLLMAESLEATVLAHLASVLPNEGCGLLAGPSPNVVERFAPCRNELSSPTRYRLDPRDQLGAELEFERDGLETIGVVHSHPSTGAWPSATDIALAPVSGWHYVIVSFAEPAPVLRSFRIDHGQVGVEQIVRERSASAACCENGC